MTGDGLLDCIDDCAEHFLRICGKRDHALRKNSSAKIGNGHGNLRRMHIQGKHASLSVQIEEGWPPSAGKPAHRSFDNPLLFEQLLHDQRNSASLQPRDARQIRP